MESKNDNKINFKYNIKEFWSILKRYKTSFFGVLILSLIIEGLFVIDKFLFKKIIDDGTLFNAGEITQNTLTETLILILAQRCF